MSLENPKIVLIGAGSAQFGYSTMGDIAQSEILMERKPHIVLHDINPDTLEKVAITGQKFIDRENLSITLSATTSRAEALAGADFCIISIEVGERFKLWEQDWRIPQQYGIRQVYGENGGPGGLFHSLRIIPPILEICEDISKICPQAFVFNFSNPMSRICTTVHRKYPELKFIGMCHEIASLPKHLPKILNTAYDNLKVRAGGLNHFSVVLEAVYKKSGKDAYPDIREKAPAYFEKLSNWLPNDLEQFRSGETRVYPWQERGVFKTILEKFGLFPITTDSHFGEYLHWAYDVADHEGILDFYNLYMQYIAHVKPKIESVLTERVIPVIDGIVSDSGYEEVAVNIPNKGLISGLPEFIVVEVPGIINKDGIRGIPVGDKMPPGFCGLLQNQVGIHNLTAEAVLSSSRDIALQALLVDPIVDKAKDMGKMLDHILDVQSDYLGYLK